MNFDFEKGEILLVNKPYKWTSFDVVNLVRNYIRKQLGIKKIKIGHAGTLDPLASGLLILCTGSRRARRSVSSADATAVSASRALRSASMTSMFVAAPARKLTFTMLTT